jgi:hypothetical protein
MDMIGSNGKPNRHYTREEQFAEADWRNAIGNALRPGQVTGKHLTEQDLQNLKMRNSRRRA